MCDSINADLIQQVHSLKKENLFLKNRISGLEEQENYWKFMFKPVSERTDMDKVYVRYWHVTDHNKSLRSDNKYLKEQLHKCKQELYWAERDLDRAEMKLQFFRNRLNKGRSNVCDQEKLDIGE